MKIALISDLHRNLRSRQDEAERVCDWLVRDLRGRSVDLVLLGGDLNEEPPTPAEEDQLAEWLLELAAFARVVGVTGNHDLGAPAIPRRRLPVHHLTDAPAKMPIAILDRPGVVRAAGCAVACLPWPRTGHLLAATGGAASEQRYQAGIAALRDVLLGLRTELEQHDGPRLLLAHAHVRGAKLGAHAPSRMDFELGLEDLALAGADVVGLGHLHKHQAWSWPVDGRETPVVYPGSPFANTWGETEQKGYVVLEIDEEVCGCSHGYARGACPLCANRGRVDWEFVPTNARLLLRPTAAFTGGVLRVDTAAPVVGAAVQIRSRVRSDEYEAARRAAEAERARLLAEGAAHVDIELEVEPVVRARTPEIASATTPVDKLAVWLRGQREAESRVERLRGMAASLEVESQ